MHELTSVFLGLGYLALGFTLYFVCQKKQRNEGTD